MTTSTVTRRPVTHCVYDGRPSVVIRTGKLGNQYGLCDDCRASVARVDAATEIMEDFRTAMRDAGQLTELVEEFIDRVIVVASATKNPRGTIGAVFEMLARERGEAAS